MRSLDSHETVFSLLLILQIQIQSPERSNMYETSAPLPAVDQQDRTDTKDPQQGDLSNGSKFAAAEIQQESDSKITQQGAMPEKQSSFDFICIDTDDTIESFQENPSHADVVRKVPVNTQGMVTAKESRDDLVSTEDDSILAVLDSANRSLLSSVRRLDEYLG